MTACAGAARLPRAAGELPSGAPSPGADMQRAAVAARVQAALAQLPERQRDVILLCHYQKTGQHRGGRRTRRQRRGARVAIVARPQAVAGVVEQGSRRI